MNERKKRKEREGGREGRGEGAPFIPIDFILNDSVCVILRIVSRQTALHRES